MTPTATIVPANRASKNASHTKVIGLSPVRDSRFAPSGLTPDSAHHELRQYEQKRSSRDGSIDVGEPTLDLGCGDLAGVARIPRETGFQHRQRASGSVGAGVNLDFHIVETRRLQEPIELASNLRLPDRNHLRRREA